MPPDAGEPLELCEECGSPLVEGSCPTCGSGFSEGTGPTGTAPMSRQELRDLLDRQTSQRTYGSLVLSMQQEPRMAPLRKEIDLLVERFSAPPELKASVKQAAERLAVKIMDDLGPTKAAIASVAQEFVRRGRAMAEVAECVSQVHPGMDRLRDLVVEVYPDPDAGIAVLVDGRERPYRSYVGGLYRKLRIPVFVSDDGRLFEVKGCRLTADGYDPKRARPNGPTEFVFRADDRSFELFKLLKEARLSGQSPGGGAGADPNALLRRFSISKLALTEALLREARVLQAVNAEYVRRFGERLEDGRGKSPRKLAEAALFEVCDALVPKSLNAEVARRHHLRPSALRSLVVRPELTAWQG